MFSPPNCTIYMQRYNDINSYVLMFTLLKHSYTYSHIQPNKDKDEFTMKIIQISNNKKTI